MAQGDASIRLEAGRTLVVQTPDGSVAKVRLSPLSAQILAAGLQAMCGNAAMQKSAQLLARYASRISCESVVEYKSNRGGIKLPSPDDIRRAKMRERARRDAQR